MPAGMESVLEGLKAIVAKWTNTQTLITEDISAGDTILNVKNNIRWRTGDEAIIRDPVTGKGEIVPVIDTQLGNTQLRLSNPIKFDWPIIDSCFLQKTFDN